MFQRLLGEKTTHSSNPPLCAPGAETKHLEAVSPPMRKRRLSTNYCLIRVIVWRATPLTFCLNSGVRTILMRSAHLNYGECTSFPATTFSTYHGLVSLATDIRAKTDSAGSRAEKILTARTKTTTLPCRSACNWPSHTSLGSFISLHIYFRELASLVSSDSSGWARKWRNFKHVFSSSWSTDGVLRCQRPYFKYWT